MLFRFGNQATCILGALIASSSMFLSSFCSSFLTLFLTYGLLGGLGLGFVYVPAVVAVGEYFRDRLSFATGDSLWSQLKSKLIFARYLCLWIRSRNISDCSIDVFSAWAPWMASVQQSSIHTLSELLCLWPSYGPFHKEKTGNNRTKQQPSWTRTA